MSRPATRMALLAGRARLSLARGGKDLLEQKRDALLREFYRDVRTVVAQHDELEAAAGAARLALDSTRVWLGHDAVSAAAAGAAGDISIDIVPATIMGVPVPSIAPRDLVRTPPTRDRSSLVSGPSLELATERFEVVLTIAISLAAMEARVRRLAREIRRTSSRVNALRTRVIPELEADTAAIGLGLEQREREDRFRLKQVKRRRAAA